MRALEGRRPGRSLCRIPDGAGGATRQLARLTPQEARTWRARYWAESGARDRRAARVFLDKAPAGTLSLPLVAKLFPRARVLFAVRDPRDVVVSCLRRSFQINAMTYAFTRADTAAACYAACMAMAEVYRAVLPLNLNRSAARGPGRGFRAELARLCGFLGLDVVPAMADVGATARSEPCVHRRR